MYHSQTKHCMFKYGFRKVCKKIVATNLQSKKEEHCYPENEYSVIIKDISEGQEPLKWENCV